MTIPALLCSDNIGSPSSMTAASTAYYIALGNCLSIAASTTEANNQTTARTTASFSKMYVNVTSNSRLTNSTLRFRKNGANGNQSVNILASTTGVFMDTTNTDSVAAGDTWNLALTTGTGTAAQTIAGFGAQYDAASDVYTQFRAQQSATAPTTASASTTYYASLLGEWSAAFNSNDTGGKFTCRAPGDFSNFYINLSANTKTTNTVAGLLKNGSAGNNIVTIGAGATGTFEDTTPHTDTVASGDTISAYITTGTGAGSATWQRCGAMFRGTGSKTDLGAHTTGANSRATTNDTYGHLTGRFGSLSNTTEALAQDVVPFPCRLSNFRVTAGIVNSTNTFKIRINGADGNQGVTVSGSGVTEDTTNHDDISANDKINFVQRSAAATSSSWNGIAVTMQEIPAVSSGTASGLIQITN